MEPVHTAAKTARSPFEKSDRKTSDDDGRGDSTRVTCTTRVHIADVGLLNILVIYQWRAQGFLGRSADNQLI